VAPSLAQQPQAELGYTEITRDTISALNTATQRLRAHDPAAAEQALRGIMPSLDRLGEVTERLRELADREHDHCVEQIAALEVKIGELYVQEQELARQVGDLEAELARASETKQLAQADVARLREQMGATAAGFRERERKLKELTDWWWVPGYGQYLAIRTLADQDAAAYDRLASTLQETAGLANASAAAVHTATIALEELTTARQQAVGTIERLQRMRATEQERLGELKKSAVFLVNASSFWGKVKNLLVVGITPEIEIHLIYLEMDLARDVSTPAFDDPGREDMLELEEGLLQFAATVDGGSNFLLEEGNEYCGGPPVGSI
jgi:hypothetical protein